MKSMKPAVTPEELRQLPLWAIIALSARSARRVQHIADLPRHHPKSRTFASSVEKAIKVAEGFATNSASAKPPTRAIKAVRSSAAAAYGLFCKLADARSMADALDDGEDVKGGVPLTTADLTDVVNTAGRLGAAAQAAWDADAALIALKDKTTALPYAEAASKAIMAVTHAAQAMDEDSTGRVRYGQPRTNDAMVKIDETGKGAAKEGACAEAAAAKVDFQRLVVICSSANHPDCIDLSERGPLGQLWPDGEPTWCERLRAREDWGRLTRLSAGL